MNFLLGVATGVVASMIIDAVRLWRSDETSRAKIRAYLSLLSGELKRRKNFLEHYKTDSNEIITIDAIRGETEKNLDQKIRYYESGLAKLRSVFDADKSLILNISEITAASILDHYQGFAEQIHKDGYSQALPDIRTRLDELITSVECEMGGFRPRSFWTWLRLWIRNEA